MDTSKYGSEMLIPGFFYTFALVFFLLYQLNIYDLRFIIDLKDFLLAISALFIGIAYLFGVLAHKLVPQFIISPTRKLLKFTYRHLVPAFIKNIYVKKKPNSLEIDQIQDEEVHRNKTKLEIKIYQYGSSKLHEEFKLEISWLIMLRSLLVGTLLFGISLAFWISGTEFYYSARFIIVLTIIFDTLLIIAHEDQMRKVNRLYWGAYNEFMDKTINKG